MATMATFVHSTWPHVKNRFYTEIQYHPLRPPPLLWWNIHASAPKGPRLSVPNLSQI